MVIQVEEIREEGLSIQEPLSTELLTGALTEVRDTGFRPTGPCELHATLHRISGGVLLHGEFLAPLTANCDRCLAPVELRVPVKFTLNLVPPAKDEASAGGEDDERGEEGGSFSFQDTDREPFDGRLIDLDPIVREQVLLALPMHAFCREDCKGLCGRCGQNLNEKQCGCETKVVDPRLAVLKDIKLN